MAMATRLNNSLRTSDSVCRPDVTTAARLAETNSSSWPTI